jgi:hypothetical protein
MRIAVELPVRTWAALDAALAYFRMAPEELVELDKLARPCRRLHRAVQRAGIRHHHVVLPAGFDKCLLRLHVRCLSGLRMPIRMRIPRRTALRLARCCLIVVCSHSNLGKDVLLEHEAEELLAARAFLTELHRAGVPRRMLLCGGEIPPLAWSDVRKEFDFTSALAMRLAQHALRAGVAVN